MATVEDHAKLAPWPPLAVEPPGSSNEAMLFSLSQSFSAPYPLFLLLLGLLPCLLVQFEIDLRKRKWCPGWVYGVGV